MKRKVSIHTDPTQGQLTRGQRKKILRLRKRHGLISAGIIIAERQKNHTYNR